MIGKLTGFVDSQTADAVILDVNGVGYLVQCSTRTLARLRPGPDRVSLAIETQMREDGIKLFGFTADVERDWFRLLQGVQGVGSKVALAILGILTADELSLAIGRGDKAAVSRAPGVGPKLAARIVAEMKDKAPSGLSQAGHDPATDLPPTMPLNAGDALAALVNLGYGRPQAAGVVQKAVAELGPDASPSSLIRLSLKLLSA